MHAFDVLGDPVRRRILELLADGELTAGAVGRTVQDEFGISQPAVSQHLRVLREHGFATVRPGGNPAAVRGAATTGCATSTPGSTASGASGPHRSTRWRPRSPGASGPDGGGTHDRRHPPDQRRAPAGRHAARSKPARPRTVTLSQTYDSRHRRPLGRLHERRADPAVVPARHRRPARRRALPARGQRRRDDRGVRPAARLRRDLGVRRRGELDRGDGCGRSPTGGTRLELEHIAHVDDERWAEFGPGAVGIGWDLGHHRSDSLHLAVGGASSTRRRSRRGRHRTTGGTSWRRAATAGATPASPPAPTRPTPRPPASARRRSTADRADARRTGRCCYCSGAPPPAPATQLVGVRVGELLPAVVHRVLAADRLDRPPVEQPLGDDEAQVPAGRDLGHQVAVLDRVPEREARPGGGGLELPPQQIVPHVYSSTDGGSARRTTAGRSSVVSPSIIVSVASPVAAEVAIGDERRPRRAVGRVGQRRPHLRRRVLEVADEHEGPAVAARLAPDRGEGSGLEGGCRFMAAPVCRDGARGRRGACVHSCRYGSSHASMRLEGPGLDPVDALLGGGPARHEPGVAQHLEVLGHRRLGHAPGRRRARRRCSRTPAAGRGSAAGWARRVTAKESTGTARICHLYVYACQRLYPMARAAGDA